MQSVYAMLRLRCTRHGIQYIYEIDILGRLMGFQCFGMKWMHQHQHKHPASVFEHQQENLLIGCYYTFFHLLLLALENDKYV